MALTFVQSAAKISNVARSLFLRNMSTKIDEKDIKKSVFISQSNDVFTNLALEDWMYKNLDFNKHHVMLLWKNDPCIVIGRNQNPWSETDMEKLEKNHVALARRNSGGGTVYHDKGNLNVTFFAPVERYNRKNNLVVLSRTLEREWNLLSEINAKEDIIVDNNYKISGTASKLDRKNTYHHCTLLVDVNKPVLKASLVKNERMEIKKSRATQSAPSPTVNLNELNSGITVPKLMAAVGWEYLRTTPLTQKDAGWEHVQQQNGFQMVNPSNEWFPGIDKIRSEFSSWEWKFATTPEFIVSQNYDVVGCGSLHIDISVDKGIVGDVTMVLPEGVAWGDLTGRISMVTSVRGQRFTPSVFNIVEQAIKQQQLHFAHDNFKQAVRA